jgi:hypothetical protein
VSTFTIGPRGIPVRDLDADDDAQHHDHEVDRNRGPLLLAEMRDDAAKDHCPAAVPVGQKSRRLLSGCKFIGGSIAAAGLRVNVFVSAAKPAATQTTSKSIVRRVAVPQRNSRID